MKKLLALCLVAGAKWSTSCFHNNAYPLLCSTEGPIHEGMKLAPHATSVLGPIPDLSNPPSPQLLQVTTSRCPELPPKTCCQHDSTSSKSCASMSPEPCYLRKDQTTLASSKSWMLTPKTWPRKPWQNLKTHPPPLQHPATLPPVVELSHTLHELRKLLLIHCMHSAAQMRHQEE